MGGTKELENQLKMEIFEEHVPNKVYFQIIVIAKFKVSMIQKNLTEESYIFKKHFSKEFFLWNQLWEQIILVLPLLILTGNICCLYDLCKKWKTMHNTDRNLPQKLDKFNVNLYEFKHFYTTEYLTYIWQIFSIATE